MPLMAAWSLIAKYCPPVPVTTSRISHRLLVGAVLLGVEPVDAHALGLGQLTGLVDVDDRPAGEVVVGGEDDRAGALQVDLVEARDARRETVADERGAPTVEGAGEERVVLRVAGRAPAPPSRARR